MEVRLKVGRYAGEIKDVAPDIAKMLIEEGRATDPRFEDEPKPVAPVAEPAPAPAKKSAGKKGTR